MHQGTVKGSDPGQKAIKESGASPVASDMSDGHEQLHARLAQQQLRIEHLERERDELESFSHALAHDLHSPLSAIDGFSVLLQESLEFWLGKVGICPASCRRIIQRTTALSCSIGSACAGSWSKKSSACASMRTMAAAARSSLLGKCL